MAIKPIIYAISYDKWNGKKKKLENIIRIKKQKTVNFSFFTPICDCLKTELVLNRIWTFNDFSSTQYSLNSFDEGLARELWYFLAKRFEINLFPFYFYFGMTNWRTKEKLMVKSDTDTKSYITIFNIWEKKNKNRILLFGIGIYFLKNKSNWPRKIK